MVERVELDTPVLESDIHLAHRDPRTLYFARSPANGAYDVFVAHRASEHDAFDPPTAVPALSDPNLAELGLDVLADGTAYVARAPLVANTSLYQLDASFEVVRELSELDDGLAKYNPFATDDELSLWFTTDRANGDEDVMVATRSLPGGAWTSPAPFIFNTPFREGSPSLTADQLVIVWDGLDASSDSNIYHGRRGNSLRTRRRLRAVLRALHGERTQRLEYLLCRY